MKGARTSLVGRVAWAAALAACSAALVAAAATSVLAAFLLQGAEDRRLREAALTLAMELSEEPPTATHVEEIVRTRPRRPNIPASSSPPSMIRDNESQVIFEFVSPSAVSAR